MIATTFFDSIDVNNRFQSIFGSIDHNSMILTYKYVDQNFQLDHDFGAGFAAVTVLTGHAVPKL